MKTVEEARALINDVIQINAHGNFYMHGCACNDARALAGVLPDARSGVNASLRLGHGVEERVRGLVWNTRAYTLECNVELSGANATLVRDNRRPTKRECLSITMSILDPLGLLSLFTIKSKLLMQNIWHSGVAWDDLILEEENVDWIAWLRCLRDLRQYQVPRCVTPKQTKFINIELHAFPTLV